MGGPANIIHNKEVEIEVAGRQFGLDVQNQNGYSMQDAHVGVIDLLLLEQG